MVSLAKKSPEERLIICRKYYMAGFAFLPLLWLINAIWFYRQAFKVEPYPQQAQIRTYVIRSAIGTVIWTVIIVAWNITFQLLRTKMGPIGDYLTFVSPRGYY
jgi:presenilin enhancer 2